MMIVKAWMLNQWNRQLQWQSGPGVIAMIQKDKDRPSIHDYLYIYTFVWPKRILVRHAIKKNKLYVSLINQISNEKSFFGIKLINTLPVCINLYNFIKINIQNSEGHFSLVSLYILEILLLFFLTFRTCHKFFCPRHIIIYSFFVLNRSKKVPPRHSRLVPTIIWCPDTLWTI